MSLQLKANEPVDEGVKRNVRAQLEKAIECLSGKSAGGAAAANEAVFEARKCFKRVRAMLRLVREDLGNDLYHRENWGFRDAARPLTEIRDAHVLVETAGKLRERFPQSIEPAVFAKIREALLANRRIVMRRVAPQKAFAAAKEAASRGLATVVDWKLRPGPASALEPGLRRVYRSGRRALALAAEDPTVANLHEWRKQSKYLWHQLQLLEAMLPAAERELPNLTHKLSTLLGQDHDLAVLRETLAQDPLVYGGHRALKDVFNVIGGQRGDLERQAFALGREIYKDSPRAFTSRIQPPVAREEVA